VHPAVQGVVLAVAADDAAWRAEVPGTAKPVHAVRGGAERAASVLAGLDALARHAPADTRVIVHDAVRPCLHAADLDALLVAAWDEPGGGLLAVPMTDSVKAVDDGRVVRGVARTGLWRALTPQLARLGVLRGALRAAAAAGLEPGDEAAALEAHGLSPVVVEGRSDNIKITHPADLALAAAILGARP
jgi:2-C-methyl-D-erythritol 4-phosphate cytidylyltransferase